MQPSQQQFSRHLRLLLLPKLTKQATRDFWELTRAPLTFIQGPLFQFALNRGLSAGATPAVSRKAPSLLTNYKQLSKFKLSSLVVLTAGAGYVAGSGEKIDWKGLLWTSLGTFGAAACANSLNQIYEVVNDRLMTRTCNRPLPAGRMTRLHAGGFALAAGVLGLSTLYYQANPFTALLGATNIILYAGIYTPMKQLSPINTWVGALVGAIPPLMGWAAASQGQLEPGAFVLAAALFSWQLPHFMALAWMGKDDYIRGGFRMLSAIDPLGKRTALVALRHSIFLLPLGALAYSCNMVTQPFAWEAAALAGVFLLSSVQFSMRPSFSSARSLFKTSLLYLPLLMLGLVIHRIPNNHEMNWAFVESQLESQVLESEPVIQVRRVVGVACTAGERSLEAVQRVFGFGRAVISDLKCPSTVHSDNGEVPGLQPLNSRQVITHTTALAKHPSESLQPTALSPSTVGGGSQGQGAGAWLEGAALLEAQQLLVVGSGLQAKLPSPSEVGREVGEKGEGRREEGEREGLELELRSWRWAASSGHIVMQQQQQQ